MNTSIIKGFIEGEKTSQEVKAFLRRSFERKRERDVQFLAAQTLALQFLEEAWQEMERTKDDKRVKRNNPQVGL